MTASPTPAAAGISHTVPILSSPDSRDVSAGRADRSQPTISVIIPAYNRARDLPGAVASVMAQTYPALEILIVDDGSSDGTEEVVSELDAPIRYWRQENQGAAAARNRGLAEATGDLVAFLDVDDRWVPDKLDIQIRALHCASEAGWCTANLFAVDPEGRRRPGHRGLQDCVPVFNDLGVAPDDWFSSRLAVHEVAGATARHVVYSGNVFPLLLHGNFVFPSATLIKRELAHQIGPFDPRFRRAEDNDYFLSMADAAPVAIVATPLVAYRTGADDAITNPAHSEQLIDEAMECLGAAVRRKPSLTVEEEEAYRVGTSLLFRRKAWLAITNLDGRGARAALRALSDSGHRLSARERALLVLSFTPAPVLRLMGSVKQSLTRFRRHLVLTGLYLS